MFVRQMKAEDTSSITRGRYVSKTTPKKGVINMRQENKIFAIAAAVMMLAVVGIAIVGASDNSDATVAQTGKMDVFFYNGTSWSHDLNITAYDGSQALQASNLTVTFTNSSLATTTTSNTSQTIGIYSQQYQQTYNYPNPEYGQFKTINNVGNAANDWSVFINIGNATNPNWVKTGVTVGWLKPFEDYVPVVDSATNGTSCATANMAIVYGTSMPTGQNEINSYITSNNIVLQNRQQISQSQGSVYEYKFTLQANISYGISIADKNVITYSNGTYGTGVLNATSLNSGITIVGYGSDANLALKQALATYYSYQNVAPSVPNSSGSFDYYSWMLSMCGKSDSYNASTNSWDYWYTYYSQYNEDEDKYVDVAFDYSLGYYSHFTGGYYEAPDIICMTYSSYNY